MVTTHYGDSLHAITFELESSSIQIISSYLYGMSIFVFLLFEEAKISSTITNFQMN